MRSEKGQENRRREEVESETLIQTERTNEGMKHKRAQKKVEGKDKDRKWNVTTRRARINSPK